MHIFGTQNRLVIWNLSKTIEIFWKKKSKGMVLLSKVKSTLYNQIPNPLELPSTP